MRNHRTWTWAPWAAVMLAAALMLSTGPLHAEEEAADEGEAEASKPSARDRLPPANKSRLIIKNPHSGDRPHILDVHAGVGSWGFGFGAGGRFTLNLVENGFVGKLNNSFGLGFGVDALAHYYSQNSWGFSLSLPVVGQWAFYLTPKWTVFAEFGASLWIRPYGDYPGSLISRYFDIWFLLGPGVIWNFSDSMSLIIRATYPYFQVGITFPM